MKREELQELHYITHFDNLTSILRRGILSHRRASGHNPTSVANPSVQAIRSTKRVPGGRSLHHYVNLYISARNAMLYSILGFPAIPPPQHLRVCVIGVSPSVLDLPGVVIADGNAAAALTGFWPSPEGLDKVSKELVFGRFWTDENPSVATVKREGMMAEVLVPGRLAPRHFNHFYVCCPQAKLHADQLNLGIAFDVNRNLFFNDGVRLHG